MRGGVNVSSAAVRSITTDAYGWARLDNDLVPFPLGTTMSGTVASARSRTVRTVVPSVE
jgi:hypothetical protein